MIHTILVDAPSILSDVVNAFEAKKIPPDGILPDTYKSANVIVIGVPHDNTDINALLSPVSEQYMPDTVFFLTPASAVSDEKRGGDVVMSNVFFRRDPALDEHELTEENRDIFMRDTLFVSQYDKQDDYDFESFGFSIGGIHVSGDGVMDETLRIKTRLAYEADTFGHSAYRFVESAQALGMLDKIYPVEIIMEADGRIETKNAIHIIRFFMGSIDGTHSIASEENPPEEWGE